MCSHGVSASAAGKLSQSTVAHGGIPETVLRRRFSHRASQHEREVQKACLCEHPEDFDACDRGSSV